VRQVILPALAKGVCVLCDRFADSTIAYQGYARGLSIRQLTDLNTFAVDGAVPDVTIVLDLDVKRGFERLKERNRKKKTGHDRIERENMIFHRKVRNGYLDMAGKNPGRFRVIDADRSFDEVDNSIWAIVGRRLGKSGR
jgi:dTMP kinase